MSPSTLEGYRLSVQQRRAWRLASAGCSTYCQLVLQVDGVDLEPRLRSALASLLSRHAVFRTRFARIAELREPLQVLQPSCSPWWREEDFSSDPSDRGLRDAERLVAEERSAGFEPEAPPLLRSLFIRMSARRGLLVLTLSGLCGDGRTLVKFLEWLDRELEPGAAQAPPLDYLQFSEWQNQRLDEGSGSAADRTVELLRSAAESAELMIEPGSAGAEASEYGEARLALEPSDCRRTLDLAAGCGTDAEVVLLAAWAVLLARRSGRSEVTVGLLVDGREPAQLDEVAGPFASVLPVRIAIGESSFVELVRRVGQLMIETRGAVHEVHLDRCLERAGLDPVEFSFPGTFETRLLPSPTTAGGLRLRPLDYRALPERSALGLTVVMDAENAVQLTLADGRSGALARSILSELLHLLREAINSPSSAPATLEALTEPDRAMLLTEWSGALQQAPSEEDVLSRIARRVAETPDASAVLSAGGCLTYLELDLASDRLAARLGEVGVGAESVVGLHLERSHQMVVAVLAVLKAGGCYLPLDPAYPPERLRFMLRQSGAVAVIGEPPRGAAEDSTGIARIDVGEAWSPAPSTRVLPLNQSRLDRAAYAIYTSGSTGEPKGVAVSHRALARSTSARSTVYDGSVEAFLLVSSLSFDSSIAGLFWTLTEGGVLVLPGPGQERDVATLRRLVAEHGVTHWLGVPSLYRAFLEHPSADSLDSLKVAIVAGEACPPELPAIHRQRLGNRTVFANEYGPTEAAVWSTVEIAPGPKCAKVAIGRPVPGTRSYVADRFLRLALPGSPGELLLGGDGLARGYLRRPSRTARSFVPDPFGGRGGRLYRTGDLVRFRVDGRLEFLGRIDRQVKIRGHRVELEEVESVLASHPAVREASAVARPGPAGHLELVAFAVPVTERAPKAEELREHLFKALPAAVVPSTVIVLPDFPRTPSGKLDRSKLPEAGRHGAGREPRNPIEEVLAQIWSEVLELERVGIDQDFHALGGHSLLAAPIVSRVRKAFEVELPLGSVFTESTVEAMASRIETELQGPHEVLPDVARRERATALPLSFAQERLWFLHHLEGESTSYNCSSAIRLDGRIDRRVLAQSLERVIERHEALRTVFPEDAGQPSQVVLEAGPFELQVIDLRQMSEALRWSMAEEIAASEARYPFRLEVGPLLRIVLLDLAEEAAILVVTMHHIISDAGSLRILIQEVAEGYRSALRGEEGELEELPIGYPDYAIWQRECLQGKRQEELLAYWSARLRDGLEPLELPTDRPRPAAVSHRGGHRRLSFAVPNLVSFAASLRATPFMVLLAAYHGLLARISGQRCVNVGVPFAGRDRPELERVIGFFVNSLVLRLDLGDDPELSQLIGRAREAALGAHVHKELPFEVLVEHLQPARTLGRAPLFQVMFDYQDSPVDELRLPGLEARLLEVESGTAKFDLTLYVVRDGNELLCTLEYNTDLFDVSSADRLLRRFRMVVESLPLHLDSRLSEVPFLSRAEIHQAFYEWNDVPDAALPAERLEQWILGQIQATPEALAVTFAEHGLSYRELGRRAGIVAARLVDLEESAELVVAICCDRSLELMVGLLGILLAGGAYLPLDPSDPPDRLRSMLDRARPTAVLTAGDSTGTLAKSDLPVLAIDSLVGSSGAAAVESPACTLGREGLAYILFTSGSTGEPKGSMVPHGGIVNRIAWMQQAYPLGPDDRVLQKTPVTFDVSLWELFWPLTVGATVVLAQPGAHRDSGYLVETVRTRRITTLHFVPSMLQAFVEEPAVEEAMSLRRVVSSGEGLPMTLVEEFSERLACPLENLYGPTEASVDVTRWHCQPHSTSLRGAPIGRPIARVELRLIDRRGWMVPIGVPGELLIVGRALARGYAGSPRSTAESFRPDPFATSRGGRAYHTGDLARFLPSGDLEFLGRIDHQVKLRGFRIELGEIEAALSAIAGTAEVAVLLQAGGTARAGLVAYLGIGAGESPKETDLRAALSGWLPDYMLPGRFVFLDGLPRTSSGKIDRRALPAPQAQRGASPVAGPQNPVEELIAEVWRQELALDQVGFEDDFFALGGHSILATRLVARLRRAFEIDLPLKVLFESPTIRGLSAAVARQQGRADSYTPLPRLVADPAAAFEPFPLTDVQQAYWVGRSESFEMGNVAAHGYTELEVPRSDFEALLEAMDRLVQRHGMLRAIIDSDGRQRVLERVGPVPIECVDLVGRPADKVETHLARVRDEMSHQVLATDRWPLFELRASLLTGSRVRLHLSVDGLISDAWSYQVLIDDLYRLYRLGEKELPPLEIGFRDYVLAEKALQSTDLYRTARDYWLARLDRLPGPPRLPLARNPTTLDKPRFVRRTHALDPASWKSLRRLAAARGLTASGLLLAAWSDVLAAWSESPRMTLNLTLFNRLPISDQVNDLVGDFTSTILLEVDASAKGSFEERARGLQRQLWEDLDHRYYSGIRVVRELARRRGPLAAAMPVVFTSTLNLERGEGGAARADQLGDLVYSITQTPQVWIDHQVFEEEGSLRFNWDAVEDLFPEGLLDSMFEAYCHFLENLAAEEDTWKARRSPLVPDEQLEQRDAVNSTAAPIPAIRLERLFLMQAETRPKHPAVISLVDSVTYGQLARRMAGVASWLRSEGAEPGRPVAIALEKGWEQPASVLGVLAAGAPYLPLDPDQPQARIDRILADGEVQHVLTTSSISRRVAWPTGVKVACVELLQPESPRSVALPPSTHNSALAYVLYTSGSTGSPKGVMVEHASVVNRILDVAQRLSIGPEDRTFGITALHHDLSVFDLFGSLCTGATMVLPGPTETRDPQAWTQLMEEHSVTLWNSVPAFLEMLVDFAERKARTSRAWRSLRHVLLAGDWIPVSLPNRVWQLNPETLFTSLGGPTETTVWDISFPVRSVDPDWESIPYGRPLTNSTYDVFDEELRPRPVWARGELFVGGACVARGYWNDPGRTAQRFLVHPKTGERLFRTGDLGRFLPSGDIEFLGRADRQVQIHGQRIELGEIEAALERHPSVRRGVVEAWESEFGRRRLAAYTVLRDGAELTLDGLRAHLAKEVPDSMVPRSLVVLESLPLSANGKVDRDQLPRPEETTEARGATESRPLPASSSRIGGLVAEVLGLAEVDPEGDLLDLGASSVDLVRISNRLDQEFAFRPSYEEFYSNPTIACLARALESSPGRKRDEVVDHRAVPANVDLILDPEEREAFKRRRLGLRRDSGLGETRPLESRLAGSEIAKRLASRRSHRRFELQPLKPEALSGLLVALRSVETDEGPRYLYPSAGGLYGVQVYLHCKRGRVSGLTAGTYYYDPNAHALRMLEPNAEIDGSVHTPFINRPAFEEAAFSLFLVAALDAIVPLYGDKALEFATLEAGYMGQLLMMEASEVDLGLCPIGSLDFERIRSHFRLGDSHRLVHSFVGGRPDSAGGQKKGEDRHAGGRQGRALRLLERVKDLDEEEAGRLLESLERDEPEDAG